MNNFEPLIPLFVPSFSSKGNLLIPTKEGKYVSDNYDLLQVLDVRISTSYLISAYDIFYEYMPKDPNELPYTDYLFIDSGGYEVSDSFDFSERNKYNYKIFPWDVDKMKEVYKAITSCPKFRNSSIVLSGYDLLDSFENQLYCIQELVAEFPNALINFIIKLAFPFEHLLRSIASNIHQLESIHIIGLTEKELGTNVQERLLNLISLKKLFNTLNWKGKIHIFGGLDPTLSKLYYIAGADIFDGLSWQRIRYRTNSTIFDPNYYNITLSEFENKYLMMIDNLAVMHGISSDLSCLLGNRSDKIEKLEELLKSGESSLQTIVRKLEVEL